MAILQQIAEIMMNKLPNVYHHQFCLNDCSVEEFMCDTFNMTIDIFGIKVDQLAASNQEEVLLAHGVDIRQW